MRPSPVSAKTDPIVALARSVIEFDGGSWLSWAFDTLLVGVVGVLILLSIDLGLAAQAAGGSGARAALIFGLAIVLNQTMGRRLAARALEALARLLHRTTTQILDAALRTDLQTFEKTGPQHVLRTVTDEAAQMMPAAALLVQAAAGLVTVCLSVAYIATVSAGAAALCLALMLLLVAIGEVNNRAIQDRVRADREVQRGLDALIDDLLIGFKQVRQHQGRGQALADDFDARARGVLDDRSDHFAAHYRRDSIGRQAFFALLGIVAFLLPLAVPDAADQTSRLLVAVTFIVVPLTHTVLAFNRLAEAGATWQSLIALRDQLQSTGRDADPEAPLPAAFAGLHIEGMRFHHARSAERTGFVLGPIDLDLKPGEIVFVTGANGSGKSTFIKLLCGLYWRSAGEMWLGDRAMPHDPGPEWRGCFSTVLADFALFERLYGYEDADATHINALLAEMELDQKVRFADGRFDTVDLSTGQRKRLALVVALVQDRPVYVFDEWAADQDPHFRAAFYRRILPALKAQGKAVVAVTHDDDAFDACDRRLHLVGGHAEAPCA